MSTVKVRYRLRNSSLAEKWVRKKHEICAIDPSTDANGEFRLCFRNGIDSILQLGLYVTKNGSISDVADKLFAPNASSSSILTKTLQKWVKESKKINFKNNALRRDSEHQLLKFLSVGEAKLHRVWKEVLSKYFTQLWKGKVKTTAKKVKAKNHPASLSTSFYARNQKTRRKYAALRTSLEQQQQQSKHDASVGGVSRQFDWHRFELFMKPGADMRRSGAVRSVRHTLLSLSADEMLRQKIATDDSTTEQENENAALEPASAAIDAMTAASQQNASVEGITQPPPLSSSSLISALVKPAERHDAIVPPSPSSLPQKALKKRVQWKLPLINDENFAVSKNGVELMSNQTRCEECREETNELQQIDLTPNLLQQLPATENTISTIFTPSTSASSIVASKSPLTHLKNATEFNALNASNGAEKAMKKNINLFKKNKMSPKALSNANKFVENELFVDGHQIVQQSALQNANSVVEREVRTFGTLLDANQLRMEAKMIANRLTAPKKRMQIERFKTNGSRRPLRVLPQQKSSRFVDFEKPSKRQASRRIKTERTKLY